MTENQKQGFIDQLTKKKEVQEGLLASAQAELKDARKEKGLSKKKKAEKIAEKEADVESFENQIADLTELIDTKKQEVGMRVADVSVQLDAKDANSDEQAKGVDLKNDLVNGILSEVELARKLEAEVLAQADRTTEGTVEGGGRPEDRAPESDVDFELPPDVVPPTPAQPKAATAPKAPATPPPTPVVSQAPAPTPATPAAAPVSPDANQPTPEQTPQQVGEIKVGDELNWVSKYGLNIFPKPLVVERFSSDGKEVIFPGYRGIPIDSEFRTKFGKRVFGVIPNTPPAPGSPDANQPTPDKSKKNEVVDKNAEELKSVIEAINKDSVKAVTASLPRDFGTRYGGKGGGGYETIVEGKELVKGIWDGYTAKFGTGSTILKQPSGIEDKAFTTYKIAQLKVGDHNVVINEIVLNGSAEDAYSIGISKRTSDRDIRRGVTQLTVVVNKEIAQKVSDLLHENPEYIDQILMETLPAWVKSDEAKISFPKSQHIEGVGLPEDVSANQSSTETLAGDLFEDLEFQAVEKEIRQKYAPNFVEEGEVFKEAYWLFKEKNPSKFKLYFDRDGQDPFHEFISDPELDRVFRNEKGKNYDPATVAQNMDQFVKNFPERAESYKGDVPEVQSSLDRLKGAAAGTPAKGPEATPSSISIHGEIFSFKDKNIVEGLSNSTKTLAENIQEAEGFNLFLNDEDKVEFERLKKHAETFMANAEALPLKIGNTVKLKDGGELYMRKGIPVTEGKITRIADDGIHVYVDDRNKDGDKWFTGTLLDKVEITPPANDQKLEDQKKEQIKLELEAIIAKVKSMDELKADPDFKAWMTKHGIKDPGVITFIVDDALGADRRIEIVKSWQNPMFKTGIDLANQAPVARMNAMVEGKPIPPLNSAKKTPPPVPPTPPGPEKKPAPEAEPKIPVVAPKEQLLPEDKESLDWKAKVRVAGAYADEFMAFQPRGHAFLTLNAEKDIFSLKEWDTFDAGQDAIKKFDKKCLAIGEEAEVIEAKLRKLHEKLGNRKKAEEKYNDKTKFKKVFSWGSVGLAFTTSSTNLDKEIKFLDEELKVVKTNLDNNYRVLVEKTTARSEKIKEFVQKTEARFAPIQVELSTAEAQKGRIKEDIRNLEKRNKEISSKIALVIQRVHAGAHPEEYAEIGTWQTNIAHNEETLVQRRDDLIDFEKKIEEIKIELREKDERVAEFRRLERAWDKEIKFRYGYFQGLRGEKFAPGGSAGAEVTGGTSGGDTGSSESSSDADAEAEPTPEAEPVRNYKIDDLVKEVNRLYNSDLPGVTVAYVEADLKKIQPDREKDKPITFKDFMTVIDRKIDQQQKELNSLPIRLRRQLNKTRIMNYIQKIENSVNPIS